MSFDLYDHIPLIEVSSNSEGTEIYLKAKLTFTVNECVQFNTGKILVVPKHLRVYWEIPRKYSFPGLRVNIVKPPTCLDRECMHSIDSNTSTQNSLIVCISAPWGVKMTIQQGDIFAIGKLEKISLLRSVSAELNP